jgi:hypothetical protein
MRGVPFPREPVSLGRRQHFNASLVRETILSEVRLRHLDRPELRFRAILRGGRLQ